MKYKDLSPQYFEFFICFIIIPICFGSSSVNSYQSGVAIENISNRNKIGNNPSQVLLNIRLTKCAVFCLKTQCRFFFYHEDMQIGHLHGASVGFSHSFLNEAGWRYFFMTGECPFSYSYIVTVSTCFRLYNAESVYITYDLKNARCHTDGGSLVKVDSAEKQYAVETFVQTATGLTSNLIIIQGKRSDLNDQWFYDDANPLAFTNWDTLGGQPETYERYIAMSFKDGLKWHDIEVSVADSMFLCEM